MCRIRSRRAKKVSSFEHSKKKHQRKTFIVDGFEVDYERETLFRFLDFMTGAFFSVALWVPVFGKAFTRHEAEYEERNCFICARHDRAICCERPQTASSEEGLGLAQLEGITGWIKVEKLGNEVVIVVGINSKWNMNIDFKLTLIISNNFSLSVCFSIISISLRTIKPSSSSLMLVCSAPSLVKNNFLTRRSAKLKLFFPSAPDFPFSCGQQSDIRFSRCLPSLWQG